MDSVPSADVSPDLADSGHGTEKRRILSAILSAVLPGAGQLSLGKARAAIAFFCAFCLLTFMYWPLRLPRSWVALQILTLAVLALCTFAAWHALRTPSSCISQGSRVWLLLLIPLALSVAFAHSNWLLCAAGVRPFGVPSTGMEPTILKGDRIVVDFRQYRDAKPKPRDVVVIAKDGLFFVKRVVGVGGDTIEGKNGAVFVNGHQLEEGYVQHLGNPPLQLTEFGPLKIPSGKLFAMGDNRDVSLDSRMPEFGLVDEKNVAGRALYIIGSKSQRDGTKIR